MSTEMVWTVVESQTVPSESAAARTEESPHCPVELVPVPDVAAFVESWAQAASDPRATDAPGTVAVTRNERRGIRAGAPGCWPASGRRGVPGAAGWRGGVMVILHG